MCKVGDGFLVGSGGVCIGFICDLPEKKRTRTKSFFSKKSDAV